jgi:membrane fusion protein, multidrug efflux system
MMTAIKMIERRRPQKPWRAAIVVAAVICAGAVAHASEVPAQLVPIHAATLSSEIAARIDAIATRVGERFRKGDVLVSFDCALPNAQLTHAQAALTEAARTLEIDRRAAAQKTTAQLELDIPAAEVLKAKADLAAAEARVSKCTIAAPFAGITVEQKMHAFEYASPGQPVIAVLDDRALEVELTVPSRWLGWLRPGTPFQLRVDGSGKTYPAKLVRLGGRVDRASQSVRAIGEVTGEAPELLPGIEGHAILTPP